MREPCPCGKAHQDVEQCDKLEIAHRALALHVRVQELEKTRDEMQARRDEAIRDMREAENAAVTLAHKTHLAAQIFMAKPEPGSLVVLRVPEFKDNLEKDAIKHAVMFLQRKHPEWTLLLTHHGKELKVESFDQRAMRAKGWVRVTSSEAVLGAALGAYRAALKRALESLENPRIEKDIRELLDAPLPVSPIETNQAEGA